MRILLTSDLHYSLKQYDWLLKAAPHFDALVIAGDHIDAVSPVPAAVQMAALSASFGALAAKTRLFVCSGNHDLNAWTTEGEKTADWLSSAAGTATVAVDGDTVEVRDTLFTVCPWWDGPFARARVGKLLDAAAERRRGRWVWIYHAPPEGLLSWNGKRHYGDAFLAGLVERHAPDAVLCGHIHEAPFRNGGSWIERRGRSWLFNAGRQIGEVPARIEIDFAKQQAQWYSLAGIEERSLQ